MLGYADGYGWEPYAYSYETNGLPPAHSVKVKPNEHWKTLVSLPEARDEVGVYGDSSQDVLIKSKLSEAVSLVEELRGIGRPLTTTMVTNYYSGAGSRLMLHQVSPMPPLGSYSAVSLTVERETGDETIADAEYFLDESSGMPSLHVADTSAVQGAGFKDGVMNPVRVQFTVNPKTDAADYEICRSVVKEALKMAYHARETAEGMRGFVTTLARMMPNRVPFG